MDTDSYLLQTLMKSQKPSSQQNLSPTVNNEELWSEWYGKQTNCL